MFVGQVNAKNARGFQNLGHGDINQLLPLGNCGGVASLQAQQRGFGILLRGERAVMLNFKLDDAVRTGVAGARGFKASLIGGGFKLRCAIRMIEIGQRERF